jgi:hypothetical protein
MGLDMGRQSGLLIRPQLARPVTAPRAGVHLAGAPPPDQRLVKVRNADPEHARRRPRRQAAVNRRQNPPPQVLRIALSLPPSHRCPQHLAVGAQNHGLSRVKSPFRDSRQCDNALGIAPHIADKMLHRTAGTIRGVAATYNRFEYLDERKAALEGWGALSNALFGRFRRMWFRSSRRADVFFLWPGLD